jgi:hypothetical protein
MGGSEMINRRHSIALLLVAGFFLSAKATLVYGEEPEARVRGWYTNFLRRDADQDGLAKNVEDLNNGVKPNVLIGNMLGCNEYYRRIGNGNAYTYVRVFYSDATGGGTAPAKWVTENAKYLIANPSQEVRTNFARTFLNHKFPDGNAPY